MKKLRNDRGETLVEVLASILIASLSVTLLFGCVMASSKMDRDAKGQDEKYYAALTAAEEQNSSLPGSFTAKIKQVVAGGYAPEKDLHINIYGGDGLYSYKRAVP